MLFDSVYIFFIINRSINMQIITYGIRVLPNIDSKRKFKKEIHD